MSHLGIIAGSGVYPRLVLEGARAAGVRRVVVAAFVGETMQEVADRADCVEWMSVGQLGRLLDFFAREGVTEAMMAGKIAPGNLFELKPDWKAVLLMARLRKRNAETIFGAIGDELAKKGITLLSGFSYMEKHIATVGWMAGPRHVNGLDRDIEFGWPIAKKICEMDIGQTIVVKKGTVLAVEGFEGTDETLRRGGRLGKGGAVAIKLSKPGQDFRFDIPVIGPDTIRVCSEAGVRAVVCEAKKTLLLDLEQIRQLASEHQITLWGKEQE